MFCSEPHGLVWIRGWEVGWWDERLVQDERDFGGGGCCWDSRQRICSASRASVGVNTLLVLGKRVLCEDED